jgi:CBS domain-containing protein
MRDVRALEMMLHEGMFESGVRRIGAEQELFMVDERGQPAPVIEEVLERNTDERIVTELTKFNVEFNMDPLQYGADCFSQMEAATTGLIDTVRGLTRQVDSEVAMTGILPTAHLSDFAMDYMTPRPRYGQYQIRGIDELFVKHDSIMLEGCNTSFQTHFQVSPEEFPRYYNIAQVVAAPCLAAATNSPLLFGKRLWRETRIALFQQAVDTRSSNLYLREMSPRVHFGTSWVDESVMEIFKEDISRFRVLLTTELGEDPLRALEAGEVPRLMALQLHNGTVYRWNRACYGITNGKPHLRIENRVLPSGPTVIDEIANAAFWYGLVAGLARKYRDVSDHIEFYEARYNFNAAARNGLASQFRWLDGSNRPAHELILDTLLPLAEEGLAASDVDAADIDRYLRIIQRRVETQKTGSQWQLDSLSRMEDVGSRAERLAALTRGMVERQKEGAPVHEWSLATLEEGYTPTGMKARLMDWQKIRHVLVEDEQHRLVGLVSHRTLLRHMAERTEQPEGGVPVSEIMVAEPISVSPECPTPDAVELMREHEIGALPVVREDRLVGIITEQDFIEIAGSLLDDTLGLDADSSKETDE